MGRDATEDWRNCRPLSKSTIFVMLHRLALSLVLTVADIAADSRRVNSAAFAAIPRCHIHETSGTDGQHRFWIT
jgi:hypothetical protein